MSVKTIAGQVQVKGSQDGVGIEAKFSELEGIIPALETAHAFAWLEKLCPTLDEDTQIVINCSGRGDKDVNTVASSLNI